MKEHRTAEKLQHKLEIQKVGNKSKRAKFWHL